MFGVAPVEGSDEIRACWMTGTELVERHPRAFLEVPDWHFPGDASDSPGPYQLRGRQTHEGPALAALAGGRYRRGQAYGVEGRPFHFFQVRR